MLTVNGTITVDHDDDTSTDALAITAGGGTYNGTYGTLVVNTDGTYTYTLDTAHASNATRVDDVFTIDVTDSDGTSHQFTVTVPVNHVDDANKESVSITARVAAVAMPAPSPRRMLILRIRHSPLMLMAV